MPEANGSQCQNSDPPHLRGTDTSGGCVYSGERPFPSPAGCTADQGHTNGQGASNPGAPWSPLCPLGPLIPFLPLSPCKQQRIHKNTNFSPPGHHADERCKQLCTVEGSMWIFLSGVWCMCTEVLVHFTT